MKVRTNSKRLSKLSFQKHWVVEFHLKGMKIIWKGKVNCGGNNERS